MRIHILHLVMINTRFLLQWIHVHVLIMFMLYSLYCFSVTFNCFRQYNTRVERINLCREYHWPKLEKCQLRLSYRINNLRTLFPTPTRPCVEGSMYLDIVIGWQKTECQNSTLYEILHHLLVHRFWEGQTIQSLPLAKMKDVSTHAPA